MQISALELNFLIFRYLEGTGFKHSAFTLGCEAGLSDCPLDRNMVPPAALVRCIQKGLEYLEMEANLSNRENDLEEDFSLIRPLDLITKDVDELKQMIMERRENRRKREVNGQHEARSSKVERSNHDDVKEPEARSNEGERSNHDNVKEHENRRQPTQSGRKNGDSRKGHKNR